MTEGFVILLQCMFDLVNFYTLFSQWKVYSFMFCNWIGFSNPYFLQLLCSRKYHWLQWISNAKQLLYLAALHTLLVVLTCQWLCLKPICWWINFVIIGDSLFFVQRNTRLLLKWKVISNKLFSCYKSNKLSWKETLQHQNNHRRKT